MEQLLGAEMQGKRIVIESGRKGLRHKLARVWRLWWRGCLFIHPSSFMVGMGVGAYMAGVSIWVYVLCR